MRLPYYIDDVNNKLLKASLERLSSRGKPQEAFISSNITEFEKSETFKLMGQAEDYYKNDNDIKEKRRVAINDKGVPIEDTLLPNNILSHADFRNIVDEKVSYMFSQPFTIKCDNEAYLKILNDEIFTDKLRNRLKMVGKDGCKKGISYLQPTFDEEGVLTFKFRPGHTIIPFWADEEHTELDAYILYYKIKIYDLDGNYKEVDYVEFVDESGVYRYIKDGKDGLKPYDNTDMAGYSGHFTVNQTNEETEQIETKEMVWEKIPLIPFKYNADEYQIIKSVKCLIDGYDRGTSDLADAIGDIPYSIKVITNYDGTDLGELAKNLYTYRMVKVSDGGDIKTLSQTIDITSITAHLDRLEDDIYKYGRIVNDKDALAAAASGKALDRLYNKIDSDANDTIAEFKASLENLMWFVNWYLKSIGKGDFENEKVEFVFNTDKPTDETSIIANCVNSKGIISDKTIISNHPWVTNLEDELANLKEEKEEQANYLLNMNGYGTGNNLDNPDGEPSNDTTNNQEQQEDPNQDEE